MCGVYGAGSSCRYGARRGACRLCRLSTLPFACFPAPIPPAPFPTGRGKFLLSYARGFAPCIPRGWRGAALVRRALAALGGGLAVIVTCLPAVPAPSGGLPGWSPDNLAIPMPSGGLASLSPVYPAFCLLSCPHPPTRARRALFPAGRGRFLLFYCKGLAGRGTGSVLRKQFGLVSPEDAGYSYSQ